jgi:hypothetical protein
MPGARAVTLATAALLLEVLPLVVAHGHGDGSDDNSMDMHAAPQPVKNDSRSYWSLTEHVGLMYMHIALEVIAWFAVLPVGRSSRVLM